MSSSIHKCKLFYFNSFWRSNRQKIAHTHSYIRSYMCSDQLRKPTFLTQETSKHVNQVKILHWNFCADTVLPLLVTDAKSKERDHYVQESSFSEYFILYLLHRMMLNKIFVSFLFVYFIDNEWFFFPWWNFNKSYKNMIWRNNRPVPNILGNTRLEWKWHNCSPSDLLPWIQDFEEHRYWFLIFIKFKDYSF